MFRVSDSWIAVIYFYPFDSEEIESLNLVGGWMCPPVGE
jgi:hypothetical protein